jgi:hypothetical protein
MFKTDKAPQVTIDPKLHKIIKQYAKENGMVLHAATSHFLKIGMTQENLLPVETQPTSDN